MIKAVNNQIVNNHPPLSQTESQVERPASFRLKALDLLVLEGLVVGAGDSLCIEMLQFVVLGHVSLEDL